MEEKKKRGKGGGGGKREILRFLISLFFLSSSISTSKGSDFSAGTKKNGKGKKARLHLITIFSMLLCLR